MCQAYVLGFKTRQESRPPPACAVVSGVSGPNGRGWAAGQGGVESMWQTQVPPLAVFPMRAALRLCSSWVVLACEPHPLSRKHRSPGSGTPARNIGPPRKAHISPDVHPRTIQSPGRGDARSTGAWGRAVTAAAVPQAESLPSFSNLRIACHCPPPGANGPWVTQAGWVPSSRPQNTR